LIAGNAAVCAGWMPTPEARMACCAEDGACPMHKGESQGRGSHHGLSQVDADNCCASSERENSSPSTPTFVAAIPLAVLGPATVLPISVPPLVLSDDWRTVLPTPTTLVPKHVLLSVFIV
jgi:hypothetical protein